MANTKLAAGRAVVLVNAANAGVSGSGSLRRREAVGAAAVNISAEGGTKDDMAVGFNIDADNVSGVNELVSLLCVGMGVIGTTGRRVLKAPTG